MEDASALVDHGWSMADMEAALLDSSSPNNKKTDYDKMLCIDLTADPPHSSPLSNKKVITKPTSSELASTASSLTNKENLCRQTASSSSSLSSSSSFSTARAAVPSKNFEHTSSLGYAPSAPSLDELLPNGWELFPHQKEAILEALKLRRVILAYDMGLGKTIISLMWAKEMSKHIDSCLTVIVCPCTLAENWQREANLVGFRDVDNSSADDGHHPIKICSWAKIPDPNSMLQGNRHLLLVFDEAHAMQTLKSQRTQAALKLCLHRLSDAVHLMKLLTSRRPLPHHAHHSACSGVLLSTGTPIKNGRPCNLLPLLIAIRHPIARDVRGFEVIHNAAAIQNPQHVTYDPPAPLPLVTMVAGEIL